MNENRISKIEKIKSEGNFLRGTIAKALNDESPKFEEENVQQLKFHGVYQQDDRDLRKRLRKEGKGRQYSMMIRARIPGGILSAKQYLVFDGIAARWGNNTMRITTRQTFQLHGILKGNLKSTIREINESLITTLGGCGDQVRNIIACAKPRRETYAEEARKDLLDLANRFLAKTNAYHEIWLDGEKVRLTNNETEEPLYGRTYLPRKFKLGMTFEEDNCADVYSNDISIVAHVNGEAIAGYTLLIGGGMGRSAVDSETHPKLATPFTFVTRSQLADTCEAIVTIQRDFGNREDRKFARMKYLVETKGMNWFKTEVEARIGRKLAEPRQLHWKSFHDHLGWHEHRDSDEGFLGLFIENGRIKDDDSCRLRSVLRQIVEEYQPTIHLTTQQNLILEGIRQSDRSDIVERLRKAGVILPEQQSAVRKNSMACPALPTCGLAIAESERVLPQVLARLEAALGRYGLFDEPITVRMTGCPNGCARPYISDIGFVGRVLGKYDIFLGADSLGTRLNERFLEQVPLEQLVSTLEPIFALFAKEREPEERFGNFCRRMGLDALRVLASFRQ